MLRTLEALIVRALAADEPLAALRAERARCDAELTAEERAMLDRLDPDGFALTALLVKKLRFERITRGDVAAQAEFDRDPEAFAALFSAYNRAVPPLYYFPRDEKVAFKKFRRGP